MARAAIPVLRHPVARGCSESPEGEVHGAASLVCCPGGECGPSHLWLCRGPDAWSEVSWATRPVGEGVRPRDPLCTALWSVEEVGPSVWPLPLFLLVSWFGDKV